MTSILIVDDEKDLLELLGKGFEQAGFRVLMASETQQALAELDSQRPL